MRAKLRVLFLSILTLWAIITLYFFGVHSNCIYGARVDRRLAVDDFEYFEITEITLEPKYYDLRSSNWEVAPWYSEFAFRLPAAFARPFFYLVTFYSNPYTSQPGVGLLTVKGIYVSQNRDSLTEDYNPGLYIDNVKVSRDCGTRGLTDSNTRFFEIRAEDVPLDVERVEFRLLDKSYKVLSKITLEPIWEERPYFMQPKPKLGYDPEWVATSLTWFYRDGEDDEIRDLILPEVSQTFPWERLVHLKTAEYKEFCLSNAGIYYQGDYRGYRDVFYVRLTYSRYLKKRGEFEDFAEQNAYIVKRDDGWRIIDVSPLERVAYGSNATGASSVHARVVQVRLGCAFALYSAPTPEIGSPSPGNIFGGSSVKMFATE